MDKSSPAQDRPSPVSPRPRGPLRWRLSRHWMNTAPSARSQNPALHTDRPQFSLSRRSLCNRHNRALAHLRCSPRRPLVLPHLTPCAPGPQEQRSSPRKPASLLVPCAPTSQLFWPRPPGSCATARAENTSHSRPPAEARFPQTGSPCTLPRSHVPAFPSRAPPANHPKEIASLLNSLPARLPPTLPLPRSQPTRVVPRMKANRIAAKPAPRLQHSTT